MEEAPKRIGTLAVGASGDLPKIILAINEQIEQIDEDSG
jgi:hypothetical protein